MMIYHILLAALAIPVALAHGKGNGNSGSGECSSSQFKWEAKNCCLDYGGPPSHEQPPKDRGCPSNWSWKSDKGCCTPHRPPQDLPPPQCDLGWLWSEATYSCCPDNGGSPTSGHHHPSSIPKPPGNGHDNNHGNGNWNFFDKRKTTVLKRKYRSRSIELCPYSLSACPVSSLTGGDFECVDIYSDLDNCGGCALAGEGLDCGAIPGAWNVGCERGACQIYTCAKGYRLARNRESCIPL